MNAHTPINDLRLLTSPQILDLMRLCIAELERDNEEFENLDLEQAGCDLTDAVDKYAKALTAAGEDEYGDPIDVDAERRQGMILNALFDAGKGAA